jgi:hypothetical protein
MAFKVDPHFWMMIIVIVLKSLPLPDTKSKVCFIPQANKGNDTWI